MDPIITTIVDKDVFLTCSRCGEPISETEELGMHCKNRCFDKENKKASKQLDHIFKELSRPLKSRRIS